MALLATGARPASVTLAVRDLDRSIAFWQGPIGLDVLMQADGRATLGAGGRKLVELVERPHAVRNEHAAGLFHLALLLPSRAALGQAMAHLADCGVPLDGAADHHVSEAIYLHDPDGHGIELYRDRAAESWRADGAIWLVNDPLDSHGILEAGGGPSPDGRIDPGTILGHIHLETHDLPASRRFWTEEMGLEVMADWRQAVFMAQDGYHHHVAANVWGRRSLPLMPGHDLIAVVAIDYAVPTASGLVGLVLTEPSGVLIRLVAPS